ncbi:MAG: hypothetical protein JST04_17235 [Bdellovibrionales bacterium]|nr:hypothetical protein [Bdellovibrionales bacterium]
MRLRRLRFLFLALGLASAHAGAADRFVVITDSHGLGQWGLEIETWLRARKGAEFDFFASGGSAPLQWLNGVYTTPVGLHETSATRASTVRPVEKILTPKLRDLWKDQGTGSATERRITVIALGTNYHPGTKFREEEISETARLIEIAQTESDACVWIGPPNMTRKNFQAPDVEAKVSIVRAAIAAAAKKTGKPECAFIDSRKYSHYPSTGADGVHYNWPGSKNPTEIRECKAWAAGVTAEIERRL